jgi:hypothetical protein
MTLRETYDAIRKPILEQSGDMFTTEVEVEVYNDWDSESGDPIYEVDGTSLKVTYGIELEYRSYGIKDITAYGFKIFPFQLKNMNLEDPEVAFTQDGMLDASGMEIRHDGPNRYFSFYPRSIELHVDKSGNVIIDKSIIYF